MMVYGELGAIPLDVDIKSRMLTFWARSSESESESYVAGAHCVLSRHGERFAWVVKR